VKIVVIIGKRIRLKNLLTFVLFVQAAGFIDWQDINDSQKKRAIMLEKLTLLEQADKITGKTN
jgi:hypothetical protein